MGDVSLLGRIPKERLDYREMLVDGGLGKAVFFQPPLQVSANLSLCYLVETARECLEDEVFNRGPVLPLRGFAPRARLLELLPDVRQRHALLVEG